MQRLPQRLPRLLAWRRVHAARFSASASASAPSRSAAARAARFFLATGALLTALGAVRFEERLRAWTATFDASLGAFLGNTDPRGDSNDDEDEEEEEEEDDDVANGGGGLDGAGNADAGLVLSRFRHNGRRVDVCLMRGVRSAARPRPRLRPGPGPGPGTRAPDACSHRHKHAQSALEVAPLLPRLRAVRRRLALAARRGRGRGGGGRGGGGGGGGRRAALGLAGAYRQLRCAARGLSE